MTLRRKLALTFNIAAAARLARSCFRLYRSRNHSRRHAARAVLMNELYALRCIWFPGAKP